MSGLKSTFSRPRRKYGATANDADGVQTPQRNTLHTPRVSDASRKCFLSRDMPYRTPHITQDAVATHQRPGSPASTSRLTTAGGGNGTSVAPKTRARSLQRSAAGKIAFPVPCLTLQSRLSLNSFNAKKDDKKEEMKSVDRTAIEFKRRFSGRPGEDWMGHVDALEIHRANKFQWNPRQFYYGLMATLIYAAHQALLSLEEDLMDIDLLAYIPGWFQTEMVELRSIIDGELTYAQLQPRTKLAILFSVFEDRFQRDSADKAWENFRFATQHMDEAIEEWGMRITRLKRRVEKHGLEISFGRYLEKWKTGTRTGFFTTQLREALWPADFSRDPVITDMYSFKAWYQRLLRRQRERQKDITEHQRLSLLDRYLQMSNKKGGKPGSKPSIKPSTPRRTLSDTRRTGPAPRVTTNPHTRLFKDSGNPAAGKDCFNCGKKGHFAKDCPEEKRPRQARQTTRRKQWRTRLKGFLAEPSSADQEEMDAKVDAFVLMLEESGKECDLPDTGEQLPAEEPAPVHEPEENTAQPAPAASDPNPTPSLDGQQALL